MAIHKRQRWYALGVALATVCPAGCMQEFLRKEAAPQPPQPAAAKPATVKRPATAPQTDAAAGRLQGVPPQHLAEAIEGLQQLDRLDPATRRQIQAQLDEANPETWPYLLRIHRLAMSTGQAAVLAKGPSAVANQPSATEGAWGFESREPRRRVESASRHDRRPSQPRTAMNQPKKTEPLEFRVREDDAVVQVGHVPIKGDWEDELRRTIKTLEDQAGDEAGGNDDRYRHVFLRILYAIDGRREDAMRPIPGLPSVEQDYWTNQIHGLTTLLNSQRVPNLQRRASEAVRYLRTAAAKAGEIGVLRVNNLAFCSEVLSYGVIKPFEKSAFSPGEEVLLYAEVENFTSESAKDGYRTSLRAWYEVLKDGRPEGKRRDLPPAEETCRHQRLDFFISYKLNLPVDLKPGDYTFQLTVEDTLGHKIATRTVPLRIK